MGNRYDIIYQDRTLEQRIDSNWIKTKGLYRRGEYSTVVVRSATTTELAANLLIKAELQARRQLPEYFVEKLMFWANGIVGKIDRILIPIYKDLPGENQLREIKKRSQDINSERNKVAHRGEFKTQKVAYRILEEAAFVINSFAELSGSSIRVDTLISDSDDDT